jgi:ParB-like chromosome segregation protein Spo0J
MNHKADLLASTVPNTPTLKVEVVPLTDLKPAGRNARSHAQKQIAQIAASIQRFGFASPILLGDDNTILAGHGRFAAAKSLGMASVPRSD